MRIRIIAYLAATTWIGGSAGVYAHEQTIITDRPGRAQPSTEGDHRLRLKPLLHQDHLTGDWGGLRPWLWRHGINPEIVYTLEASSKLIGETDSATEILGNLDFSITFDTERLGLWQGGLLFFYVENLVGQGVTSNVDSLQGISTLDANSFTRLAEYFFQQDLFDKQLRVKIGKQDANVDFSTSDITGEFVNGAISPAPNIPMPTFPDTSVGLAAFLSPVDWLSLGGAVYNGELDGAVNDSGELFEGDSFSIVQLATNVRFAGGYDGTYRIGAWLSAVDTQAITTHPDPKVYSDNYGLYLLFDQMLFQEEEVAGDTQGLQAFLQMSWAPSTRNEIDYSVSGGLMYSGLFPDPHEDAVGLAVTHAHVSDRLASDRSETIVELFYKASVTNWLSVQPDIQYINNPGFSDDDALVVLLRAEIVF